MNKRPLIVICGPTAVGKSRAAVSLAKESGEIISADSMQIYKYFDIGTAKPQSDLLKEVKHHLISIVEPSIVFSAYDFKEKAGIIIGKIYKRKKIPFVTGGTGLYIRALVYGLSKAPGKNDAIRRELDELCLQKGLEFLYFRLKKIDESYAKKISACDKTRIMRALEVYSITGKPFSYFIEKHNKKERYKVLWIGLTLPREILYEQINKRTQQMFQRGLIEETKTLLTKGYPDELLERKGIGYKEALNYIHGRMTMEDAIAETQKKTRNYAKRQMTWFKKEPKIRWFSADEINKIKKYLENWLKNL